ncbi:OBCAM protein, partial [Corythaeola cristata]|nr:OBCAM protein [Corythaeola cristata]
RCTVDDRVTRVAWLNRSTILYAGNDKWSIDNRVVILSNTKTQYSIKIHNVDVYDEGPYTCSVQTDNHPKTSRVHLIVQGEEPLAHAAALHEVSSQQQVAGRHFFFFPPCGRSRLGCSTQTWHAFAGPGAELASAPELTASRGSGSTEASALEVLRRSAIRYGTGGVPRGLDVFASNTGASVGQKGILQCEASAVPVAEFQWFKEDTRLANGLEGVRIESKGRLSTLTFFNVSEKDYGNYTCVATNKLGNTNASIILYGPGAVHDGGNAASRAAAGLCLWATLLARLLLDF